MEQPQDTADAPPMLQFDSQAEWEAWLAENHATSEGVWLRFLKKKPGVKSLTYAEAIDVALCYGWIDSQSKGIDEQSWRQRFTPRKAKSKWSKVNREKVARLIAEGRMQSAGLAAIEAAKADGRWDAAYDSPANATVPPDLQAELDRNTAASAFFATLDSRNRYAILHRIQTAKQPATRAKRIRQYVEMLERQEKIYA
jgi:uncharacterized protein YdeI (YjbR/CyaY-like superfamily)